MNKGLLVVISGPSGVGKGTIIKNVLQSLPSALLSVSMTTRLPRAGEVEGKDYFFVTKEKFLQLKEEDYFLEWAEVFGCFYGTPKHFVEKNLQEGKIVILEIDVKGAKKLKDKNIKGVYIFITTPSIEVLKERLIHRATDSEEKINYRLGIATKELEEACNYDYVVVNDKLYNAVKEVKNIIINEYKRRGI